MSKKQGVDVDEGLLVMQPSFSNSEDNVSLILMNSMQLKDIFYVDEGS